MDNTDAQFAYTRLRLDIEFIIYYLLEIKQDFDYRNEIFVKEDLSTKLDKIENELSSIQLNLKNKRNIFYNKESIDTFYEFIINIDYEVSNMRDKIFDLAQTR